MKFKVFLSALPGLLSVPTQAMLIYSDSFTAADGTIIPGLEPEINNGVPEATFHESGNFWSQNGPVGIYENRAQLGADNQANLPIAADGDFQPPEKIGVSILLNMGTTAGPTTATTSGEQRGVGLGFFAGTSNLATPDDFRGLVITTDGRFILAQHGFGGSARAGFIEEIANGIDTSVDHTLSFEIDTFTGDISKIFLDDVEQPDVETSIFSTNINHVGFMVSSQSGGTFATYDDFEVSIGGGRRQAIPEITSITQIDTSTFELTVTSTPETPLVLTTSDTLESESFGLLGGLSQGSEDDPGTLNPGNNVITTDENGDATFRFTSEHPRRFFRILESIIIPG